MRRLAGASRRDEGGFTLVELLAVIGIVAVIAFPLTEAFILGLKTTDANTNSMYRSVTLQAVQSYFTGDAQSASEVSRLDARPPAEQCADAPEGVFLHLSWTDPGSNSGRYVSYAVEDLASVAGQAELVRWSCVDQGAPDKKMLGRFTFGPPLPELALCDGAPCPETPQPLAPARITLKIPTDHPDEATTSSSVASPRLSVDLTVQRRMA